MTLTTQSHENSRHFPQKQPQMSCFISTHVIINNTNDMALMTLMT